MDFLNRVAVVTGGTGAGGRVVARELAAAGATVIVPYRNDEAFARLRAEFGDLAARLEGQETDITDESRVDQFVSTILSRHGRIDFLVNMAGGYTGGAFTRSGIGLWDRMFQTNLRTALFMTHSVLPHLLDRGEGRVVTIGSRSALEPSTNASAYAASKAAVIAMTQAVAREIRASGVTINCVAPGTIDTEANREAMPKGNPARWVQPSQLASLILYLCSDAAAAINGAVIPIYGQL
jgi:NAD(P)-dependent dehydrogenase (short-subunit alcohol dehydrogenase family)